MELRLDFLQDLNVEQPAAQLQEAVSYAESHGLKCILTLRPSWEGYDPAGFRSLTYVLLL